jgi:hypothetical protein
MLERLNREFGDIVARGRIECIAITPAEAREGDGVGLARIAFFPEHNFGRIRQLIDALNDLTPDARPDRSTLRSGETP